MSTEQTDLRTADNPTLTPDTRAATAWLNYRHHVVPDPYKPMGPNLLGELLWPIDVTHHADGTTTVGFSLIAPPGLQVAS